MTLAPTPPRTPVTVMKRPPRGREDFRRLPAGDGGEMLGDEITGERLGEVFGRTQAAGDIPIGYEIGCLAHHKHAGVWLHDLREVGERRKRLILAADIDDQDTGCRRLLLGCNGNANAAAANVDGFGQGIRKTLPDCILAC